jgi:hypothetical protein
MVHLALTESGYWLLNELKPLDLFTQVEAQVAQQSFKSLESALQSMLMALHRVNQSKTFGTCRSCQYFSVEVNHYLQWVDRRAIKS